jgi:hypothetical protein
LAAVAGCDDPRRAFAALCGLADSADDDARRFLAADLERIDAALEELSPQVADRVDACCPNCGATTQALLDPLGCVSSNGSAVLRDVHVIARAYGWDEAAILALPSARRRGYCSLILADKDAGSARLRRVGA